MRNHQRHWCLKWLPKILMPMSCSSLKLKTTITCHVFMRKFILAVVILCREIAVHRDWESLFSRLFHTEIYGSRYKFNQSYNLHLYECAHTWTGLLMFVIFSVSDIDTLMKESAELFALIKELNIEGTWRFVSSQIKMYIYMYIYIYIYI